MYIYVCACIYIHYIIILYGTYFTSYIYICIYVYIHYMLSCIYMCVYIYLYMYICYMYMCIHACIRYANFSIHIYLLYTSFTLFFSPYPTRFSLHVHAACYFTCISIFYFLATIHLRARSTEFHKTNSSHKYLCIY